MSKLKIKDGDQWTEVSAGGIGVPSGGTTGQVLKKSSNTDYATEWDDETSTIPSYGTSISLYPDPFPLQPTSSTTASYTFPSNGFVTTCFERGAQGYTISIYIDGTKLLGCPSNYGVVLATPCFPVRKGQVMTIKTDSSSATWIVREILFFPY